MDNIENIDHTGRYIHKLAELNGLPINDLASGLYIVLHAEHDIVIRLHERLKIARREIELLKDQLADK